MANTTNTVITTGGGDYSSLSAAEAGIGANSYGAGETATINCSGSTADTTAVTFAGWDADVTIKVYGDNTTGIWSTSYYRITPASATGITVGASDIKLELHNVQIKVANAEARGIDIPSYRTGVVLTVDSCILTSSGGDSHNNGIDTNSNGTFKIFNTVIYGFANFGIYFAETSTTANYFYNNTIYGCNQGIRLRYSTTALLKNNICYNNGTDYAPVDGTNWQAGSTNNLSKDTTAPALNTYYISKTLSFTNVTAGSEDFHLVSGDTDAIDKGADLSAEYFTDDIDGVTRSGTWDIGADEYVAAASGYTSGGSLKNVFIEW